MEYVSAAVEYVTCGSGTVAEMCTSATHCVREIAAPLMATSCLQALLVMRVSVMRVTMMRFTVMRVTVMRVTVMRV